MCILARFFNGLFSSDENAREKRSVENNTILSRYFYG
nr:MAG TPA: hypothetical protein [Bacteriophage sp.]